MIGQTISHYEILEKLGEGGMGVVYKAEDTKLKRVVALKFLPHHLSTATEEQARFIQEAQSAATLNHPNVCTIHAIEEDAGQHFIVMEYVDGVTLRKKFEDAQLKVGEVATYAIQIGEALLEAHSRGIVHRDIKSDNIMVNSKNQIKVMDFGLAKLKGSLKLTRTSSTVGTLAYMAPEQIQGSEPDTRSDIFSFGVVLFEMLTGHLPFRGEHEAAMVYSIVNEEPEPAQKYRPEVSPEFLHILNRALEKDPNDRYQSVSEMVIDLRRLKKESTGVSRRIPVGAEIPQGPQSLQPAIAPTKATKRKLWYGLGAIVLLAIIAGVFVLIPRRPTERPAGINPNMTFRVLQIPFTQIYYPGLSPDGNWVAFPGADASGRWDVYFMNTSGGEPRRITSDSSLGISQTDISPDGSQITYDRYNPQTQKLEVCAVSSLGGLSRRIAETGLSPRWRPDGQCIGYMLLHQTGTPVSSKSGKFEIWSVKPDGSDNRLEIVDSVSVEGRISFSWSPDGKSLAWIRSFPEGYQEVFLTELGTGKEHQLTFDKKNIDEVCWTRSNEIIFSSNKSGNTNLWMVPVAGGSPMQITKGSGPDLGMKISADGKKLVYLQQQQIGHIWTANVDGSDARQVTFDDRNIESLSLSPDGKLVAFSMYDPDPLKPIRSIYVMEHDGSNRRRLTSGNEIATAPRWSPDGRWVAYRSWSPAESADSSNVYLIEATNPSSPKTVGKGLGVWWVSSTEFVLFTRTKSFLTSVDGTEFNQFYEDSTSARPILGGKYILFRDLHQGEGGWWLVSSVGLKGSPGAKPKKIHSGALRYFLAPDGKSLFYARSRTDLWRISLPDGKEEHLRGPFPSGFSSPSASYDGKEMVYVDSRVSAKLVMIENLH
jgi:Tol biopolymer transport system component/predicted Ser/Thr protein kinase